jgi:hypothetical protein
MLCGDYPVLVARFEDGWDVVGPVQAELFLVWRHGNGLQLTGPCGADAWYLQLAEADHPVEVVDRTVTDVVGSPRLVHSTSWRRERGGVVLTFLVVIDPARVGQMASVAILRSDLARSQARNAPAVIAQAQVLEHALRHLAWLAGDDPVVAGELDDQWRQILAGYTPEPFRALG